MSPEGRSEKQVRGEESVYRLVARTTHRLGTPDRVARHLVETLTVRQFQHVAEVALRMLARDVLAEARDGHGAPVTDPRQPGYGRGRAVRPDQADPADWTPNRDGTWRSPAGRTFRSATVIGPLVKRRKALGLSTSYAEEP